MEGENALLIRIDVKEKDGWFVATSKDLAGFVLAHPDESELLEDLPRAVKLLIDLRFDVDCKVVPSKFGKPKSKAKPPWLVMPACIEQSISMPAVAA